MQTYEIFLYVGGSHSILRKLSRQKTDIYYVAAIVPFTTIKNMGSKYKYGGWT